ncbi:MAG TPA: cation:proton antiporter [Solirubrobacteraceae bacterium]|nr:cation:proton antiporter [Solirubrobacteraceae bacterium]
MGAVDEGSFLAVTAASALAAILAAVAGSRLAVPVVVLELVLGIVAGPQVLGLVQPDDLVRFLAIGGLGMLFFFAGYEIDFARIAGRPLRLAAWGWLLTLVLAYGIGGLLAVAGVVVSLLYTGSAMATTAIGTLLPILGDAGELRTRGFGTYVLGAGAVGEFGPILLMTLVLSTTHPVHEAAVFVLFVALALLTALFAVRASTRGWAVLERSLATSGQAAIRVAVVLVFGLLALAAQLRLDVLLGGFVAGIIARQALRGREVAVFESKLVAVAYGFFIPFFFVYSGVTFDLDALTGDPGGALKVPLFLALFLVVRGVPALLLYRGALGARDRLALAFYSATELPLVVAITTLAVEEGHMRTSTAAALVGAAILSTLAYPLVALGLRRQSPTDRATAASSA